MQDIHQLAAAYRADPYRSPRKGQMYFSAGSNPIRLMGQGRHAWGFPIHTRPEYHGLRSQPTRRAVTSMTFRWARNGR